VSRWSSLTNNELRFVSKVSRTIAFGPHGLLNGGLRFPLAFHRKLGGCNTSQHLPGGAKVIEVEAQRLRLDMGINARLV